MDVKKDPSVRSVLSRAILTPSSLTHGPLLFKRSLALTAPVDNQALNLLALGNFPTAARDWQMASPAWTPCLPPAPAQAPRFPEPSEDVMNAFLPVVVKFGMEPSCPVCMQSN